MGRWGGRTARNAEPVDPAIRTTHSCHRIVEWCRALELGFKAFLALKGCSLEQMAGGPFGHNLEGVLVEAESRDLDSFVKLDERQRNEIARSSSYYRGKVLEYPALAEAVGAYPGMPNASLLIEAATILIAAIDEPCTAAE
jgi:hypothetical protein